ncbi:hypothetical protein VTJ83DRAFT_2475 [Remersonia thermophila]|uniref:Tafazzin family protein n=1 Tax=Remersonia thermophila TaxID=72144 RepID=A0ABR4DKC2_9PEZI
MASSTPLTTPPLPPPSPPPPPKASLSVRLKSAFIMGMTGVLSKWFLYGFNRVEVTGFSRFLDVLESRRDPAKRQRGLLTVSNHISILDDPVVWGILPFRYMIDPSNLRWTLGAADICFTNRFIAGFFSHGQVLPCHRLKHSPLGGPWQPSLAQAIRLLSGPHPTPSFFSSSSPSPSPSPKPPSSQPPSGSLAPPSPAAPVSHAFHPTARMPLPPYSWVHVFPEGCVHQHPSTDLRYFKWGLARLLLESDPAPLMIPVFIDGMQRIMPEDRGFPRFLPRIGRTVRVAFGEPVDFEARFGDLKKRWDELVERETKLLANDGKIQSRAEQGNGDATAGRWALGELPTEELRCGKEAQEIRIELARRVREEVLKVRRSLGHFPEPDPSFGLAETWRPDDEIEATKYKSRVDGSRINQD